MPCRTIALALFCGADTPSPAPGRAAIPVTVFITTCFGIANDNEAPESWLEWTGWRKLLFGLNGTPYPMCSCFASLLLRAPDASPCARAAHRRWHYTRGEPPVRYVKWFVRSAGAPPSETVANLCRSFWAPVTGTEPPWVVEAREAAEEAAGKEAEGEKDESEAAKQEAEAGSATGSQKSGSTTSSVRSAKELSSYKRQVMVIGLIATLICWAIFVWCAPVDLLCTCAHVCSRHLLTDGLARSRFIFTCACTPACFHGCSVSHAATFPVRRRYADLPAVGR